jgi:acyl carrier protein
MKDIKNVLLKKINESLTDKGSNLLDEYPSKEIMLDSDLDSMDIAVLIAELEDELGYDPFSSISEPIYPETFEEFLEIYIKYAP